MFNEAEHQTECEIFKENVWNFFCLVFMSVKSFVYLGHHELEQANDDGVRLTTGQSQCVSLVDCDFNDCHLLIGEQVSLQSNLLSRYSCLTMLIWYIGLKLHPFLLGKYLGLQPFFRTEAAVWTRGETFFF